MKSGDTSKEMDDAQLLWYRRLSSSERCFYTAQMMDEGKFMISSRIKSKNPTISDVDLRIETFKRMYSQDFSPEEMEVITNSMRVSLEKYNSESKL